MDELFQKVKEIALTPLVLIISCLLIFNSLIIVSIECYCGSIKDVYQILNRLPFLAMLMAMMLSSVIPIIHWVVKKLAEVGKGLDYLSIKAVRFVGAIIFAFDVLLIILLAKECISIVDGSRDLGTYIINLLSSGNL